MSAELANICDVQNAEKFHVNKLIHSEMKDSELFADFSTYALKTGQHIKGEQLLLKELELNGGMQEGGDVEYQIEKNLTLAGLMLARRNFPMCKKFLDRVLDAEWTNVLGNILFGLYYKLTNWPEMSRKHFAIGKAQRMRDLSILPPKNNVANNFRQSPPEFKVEIIDW